MGEFRVRGAKKDNEGVSLEGGLSVSSGTKAAIVIGQIRQDGQPYRVIGQTNFLEGVISFWLLLGRDDAAQFMMVNRRRKGTGNIAGEYWGHRIVLPDLPRGYDKALEMYTGLYTDQRTHIGTVLRLEEFESSVTPQVPPHILESSYRDEERRPLHH